MTYLGVSDLKQSRRMWEILGREKEVILTRDGKPGALILEISPEGVEATVAAVRRALFSEAASGARYRVALHPPKGGEIEAEIGRGRQGESGPARAISRP